MKTIRNIISVAALSASLFASVSFAQDHHDDHPADHHDDNGHYVKHDEWKKGQRMNDADWARGQHIDYKQYHLHAPPRGYEWRQVDGNYVLAAAATGLISSVIIASSVH
jgi:Ni/Co efflux regulator RcnB